MNKSSLSLVVIAIFLLGLFVGTANLFADSRGYDDQEKIRRAQERIDQIDKHEQEQAKQRYDSAHRRSENNSSGNGILLAILLIFGGGLYFIVMMGNRKNENEKRDRENKLMLEIAQEEEKEQKRERMLSEATSLGFNIDGSYKICPACAETIKLKAEICKHCKRNFSINEVQEAINSALNIFFQNK